MRKSYSREFKAAALDEIKKVGRSNREVAQEHDIPIKTLEKWITAYNKDNDYFEIGKPPEETNVKQLERQIARLERENEILKKTIALLGGKPPLCRSGECEGGYCRDSSPLTSFTKVRQAVDKV